jgi:hypothetical protein
LLRLKTAPLRRCLTEVEKQMELMAKFGERPKSGCLCMLSFLIHHWFNYIVTRHIAKLQEPARYDRYEHLLRRTCCSPVGLHAKPGI